MADIARDSCLDESYVKRLFSGERINPDRDVLILLSAFGLELSVDETDQVLASADYRQLILPQSLRWTQRGGTTTCVFASNFFCLEIKYFLKYSWSNYE